MDCDICYETYYHEHNMFLVSGVRTLGASIVTNK